MKNSKTLRRLMSVALSSALLISLASCSSKDTGFGNLDKDATYLTNGNYSISKGDVWNELQWSASSELESQTNVVVLKNYINKIEAAVKNNYDGLSDSEKALFGENEYPAFVGSCNQRLMDYVIQDIFNFTYDTEDYWDEYDNLEDADLKSLTLKYIDEMYMTYRYELTYDEIVNACNAKNRDFFLKIAKDNSQVYYVKYANELLAEAKLTEEANEADSNDTNSDDNKIGAYTKSDYISEFKKKYLADYDVNLVLLRFSDSSEYDDTLRAFGLKVSSSKIYFVGNEIETGSMTYNEYCDYYDDLTTTQVRKCRNVSENSPLAILGLYIEMYNYIYGGYRQSLPSALPQSDTAISSAKEVTELNDLRKLTEYVLENFSDTEYDETVELLKNSEATAYTKDELTDISSTFQTYVYDTLDLNGINYSTSSQSANSSYYIAYKFNETEHDETFEDFTDDDIIEYVTDAEHKDIYTALRYNLIRGSITSTKMDTYLSDEVKTCKIKIFNEATEITYLSGHTDYSKTFGKASNANILATITYNNTTYNLNIVADSNDESSVKIPGKAENYGLWNKLEVSSGQTTAIDLLSKKIIKSTDEYANTNKNRDTYSKYIEALLYNFSNGSTSYSASLGKYNYLMLTFHTASIDDIIDNYYRVQFASVNIIVDYASDDVIDFIYDYCSKAYDNYFSMAGKRLVVYLDCDDDGKADEVPSDTTDYAYLTWNDKPYISIDLDGDGNYDTDATYEEIAKDLIYKIYNELSSSSSTHVDTLTSLVSEINSSARVEFDSNPILSENKWAKYRRVGLNVKVEDYTVTNTSVDSDFALKQRLYDYSRGYSLDSNGLRTATYQYFIGDSTPSEYIEPLTDACTNADDDQIVYTKDGYNLIIVTEGKNQPSAEWSVTDHEDDLFTNIVIKYNEEYIQIPNVYNEGENDEYKLNKNQIKVYLLEQVVLNTSNLLPSDVSDAVSTFLSPVVTRFTSDATQLELVINKINENGKYTFNVDSTDKTDYDAMFNKVREINQSQADNYLYIYEAQDTTGTCNNFPDWWENLAKLIGGNK